MVTQLGNVTVVVKDLSRSLRFFRDKIGLRLAFYDRKHKWVCFDAGRMAFSLTTAWNREAKKMVGRRTGLSFYVDDIEKTVKSLQKKHVTFNFPPRKQPWGGILANFQDPDGNSYFLLQMPPGFDK
ncbi:MAG: VOC family protein [Gemmatimonadales bacterium]|jgi:catechol 2,3-dioxygenase-like lactoylglutathione lyase family enzyme